MRLLRRLRYWLRLGAHHADLGDEVAFHREMLERDLIRRGMTPADARDHARRTMGNETLMREESRGVWLWPSLEAMWQDATYTLRDLRGSPVFTIGVVLTLGLGIGANAAMFSLVDRLLFRPPARMIDPGSVNQIYLYRTSRGVEGPTGGQYARYMDLARWSTTSSQVAGAALSRLAIGAGEDTRVRNVAVVSASFFDLFDAPPIRGRYFTPQEDTPPAPASVVVLGGSFWKTQLGARDDVLGSTVRIGAVAYTVIGIAPDDFVGLWPYRPPAAFIPVATYAASRVGREWVTTYGSAFGLGVIARRKPGVTESRASADFTNALRRSYQVDIGNNPNRSLEQLRPRATAASILPERGPQASSTGRVATWLSGVAIIVLLIACANVANLLLARTIRRRREIAVRLALGITRARLFGQLLTEGIVLAAFGGIAGILIGVWASRILTTTFLPGSEHVSLLTDTRTILFASVVVLAVGVLTGLAPMIHTRSANLTDDLKAGSRGAGRHPRALRTSLVLFQSALCVVLLVGAGLFVQSLRNVRGVRLGFDPDSVLVVDLNMRDTRIDSAAMSALRLRLVASARQVAGVTRASLNESVPFDGMSSYPIFVAGIDSVQRLGQFHFNAVGADYFATMGTRIVRGRGIDDTDRDGGRLVIVVGESMASALWPGEDPIGKCVRVGLVEAVPCRYVVGVAQNIRSESLDSESRLHFYYLAAAQWRPNEGGLFIRVGGDARRLLEPVRQRLQRDMPGTSYVTVRRLEEIVDGKRRAWITGAMVFTAFGLLALTLAAVGLYSVIAYNVTQRRHEIGVRLALGAARLAIVRIVVTESIRFAVIGTVIGSGVALWAGHWIAPLLFHQSANDPLVFGFVGVVLVAVAIAASSIPAARAARVDPKAALQSD